MEQTSIGPAHRQSVSSYGPSFRLFVGLWFTMGGQGTRRAGHKNNRSADTFHTYTITLLHTNYLFIVAIKDT